MVTGALRLMTGFAEVKQVKNEIIVTGISAENLARDMKLIWATSKIASNMFTKVTWTEVRLPAFFALEFDYVLRRLLENRNLNSSKRVIRNILEGLRENTWIRNLSEPVQPWFICRAIDKAFVYDSLLPHQMEFLHKYEETVPRYGLKGMLLAAAPGAGKTAIDIALSMCVNAEKVIIVCPKNASIRVWQKTLEKELRNPQYPYIAELHKELMPDRKYHIFHYEALDRAVELAKLVHGQNVCVILDESHNLNEIKSLRTQLFLKVCILSGSQNIVWASGTPIKAMGFEAIPLLKSIDPLFTDETEQAFRKMFGRDAKKTLDILAYRLGLITHSVPKQNVMSDKPETETIFVKMPNSDKYTLKYLAKVMADFVKEREVYYRKNYGQFKQIFDTVLDNHQKTLKTPEQVNAFRQYNETIQYIVRNGFDPRRDGELAILTNRYEKEQIVPQLEGQAKKEFVNAKSVVKYVDLKIRGECLGRILTKERIQCHVDMLAYVPFADLIRGVEKKTLIFTSYVKVVDAVYELLSKQDFKPLRVYGETNNELSSIVNRFEKDTELNPLIATYQSLSTAVPLTMANGIIFLNNPWRSYEKEQAVARAHRIGQDKTVYCFDIILDTGSEVNISSRSLDIMQWSKEQVDAIMGIQGDVNVSVESNGFISQETLDWNSVLDDVAVPVLRDRRTIHPCSVRQEDITPDQSGITDRLHAFYK